MKTSKTKAGFTTLLIGCIAPVLIHFYTLFAGLEANQRVDELSKVELWSFIIMCSILGGIAVAISMGIVSLFSFIYERLTGKNKNKPDYL